MEAQEEKEVSVYPVNGIKTVAQLLTYIRQEFPDTPFAELKLQFGLCLWIKGKKAERNRKRVYKGDMR